MLLPTIAMAQTDYIAPLIDKYSSLNNCSTVVLSGEMLKSMGANSGVKSMQAIAVEDPAMIDEFSTDIAKITSGYALLMSVNSNGSNIKIYRVIQYYKQSNKSKHQELEDILIIAINGNEGIAVRLTGNNIELSEATSLININ